MGRAFRIFAEQNLDEYLQRRRTDLQAQINDQQDNYILNVNEGEFTKYLVNQYSIENLSLEFDEMAISTYEKMIPAEQFPSGFDVEVGRHYLRDIIKYHIPFLGEDLLLHSIPNPHIMWSTSVMIEEGCVCFEIINFYNSPEAISNRATDILNSIKQQLKHVIDQVSAYNLSLEREVKISFQTRKQHILKKYNLLATLGVPLKKKTSFPSTFNVPTPQTRKKIQITQPHVLEQGYKPEPTLGSTTYQEILQVIHDVGRQFEKMSSTYSNKGEEALRDHFLLVLEPRFEGSATGETFNKLGKTDILLRYNGTNVFIAECKFWKGMKGYLETIDQLLSYLTWRDSKSAVIMFVQNKDFSSVLKTIETETIKHSNYLGFVDKRDDTWFNYRFHINGDRNREVRLAVLLFHIPTI